MRVGSGEKIPREDLLPGPPWSMSYATEPLFGEWGDFIRPVQEGCGFTIPSSVPYVSQKRDRPKGPRV